MFRYVFLLYATVFLLLANEPSVYAEESLSDLRDAETNTRHYTQKLLYLSYEKVPKRLIKGQIFSITLRIVCVLPDMQEIRYKFSNAKGVKILQDGVPQRKEDGKFIYDTFYFEATDTSLRLPDITATVSDSFGTLYSPQTLKGKPIETIALNPKKDFCGVIAERLEISKYKTSSYDETHNILVFSAFSKKGFLHSFHLEKVHKQGFESLEDAIDRSKMIYFAVIDHTKESVEFSYFNTLKNDFVTLSIPIIVEDDRVVTQSDLKPKDQSKQQLKMLIAAAVIAIGIILLLWRKKYIYILLILIPGVYLVIILIPQERICLKKGSKVHILPMEKSTVFSITDQKEQVDKLAHTKDFVKVELPNKKIGWVANEDLCTY